MKKYSFLLLLFSFNCSLGQTPSLKAIFEKDTITIVITDSGLGGLSVAAGLEKNMQDTGHFAKINLIFVNALFDENTGYNSISDRNEKIKILNSVLEGIEFRYHPDLILIACNTLSVIFEKCSFVEKTNTPVVGIVDIGVQEIKNALDLDLSSSVIIFGTETTIEEDNYRKKLIQLGVSDNRITSQACSQLQQYIEIAPDGEETGLLIMTYVDESLEKAGGVNSDLYVSLNCSHFGYSEKLWIEAFNAYQITPKSIINPNLQMSRILMDEEFANRFNKTDISIAVVSKVIIQEANLMSISKILANQSITVSQALTNYQLVDNLF